MADSSQPPAKLLKSELYKPPTNEELSNLHETEVLFHSNLVKLQIQETLREITVSQKKCDQVNEFLHSLHDSIMSMSKIESSSLQSLSWLDKSVSYPFVRVPKKVKGTMGFMPPVEIKLVGSYQLDTFLKQNVNIDLLLVMPKECLQAKDHLNQRYLRKRAVYLAHVAEQLSQTQLLSKVEFSYFMENPLKPTAVLTPADSANANITVRLHACPEAGCLKIDRFLPTVGNVRQYWYNGDETTQKDEVFFPTPHYNSCVLMDLLMEKHLCFLYELFHAVQAYKDALKLLKVWLRQRDLNSGYGCFSGFLMSMLLAYLASSSKINKFMSSYQVIRNIFKFLSSTDWTTTGLSFDASLDLAEFHNHYEVVFVDPFGKLNLCATMPAAVFYQVSHDAKASLAALDDHDGLNKVFMQSTSFAMKYDQLLHLISLSSLKKSAEKLKLKQKLVDCASNCVVAAFPFLASVLAKGLGKRLRRLGVRMHAYGSWNIDQHPPSWKDVSRPVTFGLLLDRDYSTGVLEKGPVADAAEAASFRLFWGDKSELRRFQDGAICEAVLWEASSVAEQRCIPIKICKYLLGKHFGIAPAATVAVAGQLENFLDPSSCFSKDSILTESCADTGDEISKEAAVSFNRLCQKLRSLSLPLAITSIQGVSPIIRGTEVYPCYAAVSPGHNSVVVGKKRVQVPVPSKACPAFAFPVEAICHLEGSGKWPQDAEGLRRLKAAFHATISDELQKAHPKLLCVPLPDHLVVLDDGFAFHISVAYHREILVLQTRRTPDGMVKTAVNPESLALEKRTVKLPLLAGMLHGLGQAHPAFGETCRLVKRWVNSQLLSGHIAAEAVELLVASLFTDPLLGAAPGSCHYGFVNFLRLASSFDFASGPVVVNLQNKFSRNDIDSVISEFSENRHTLPALCISTPEDRLGTTWTNERPSKVVLRRLQDLAKLCLVQIDSAFLSGKEFNVTAFTPSLKAYDVVIHLKPKWLSERYRSQSRPKSSASVSRTANDDSLPRVLPILGFDPLRNYIDELVTSFDDLALFFHDADGGTAVGVLWRPNAFDPKPFKIGASNNAALLPDGRCAADVRAVLEDFDHIGCGFVDWIEICTEKWRI